MIATESRIRHHHNRNDYCYAGEKLWVRDFTKTNVIPVDINELVNLQDMNIMLRNETENAKKTIQRIDTESFVHPNVVIVSTGYLFKEKCDLLNILGDNVVIMGVNDILNTWSLKRRLNYYIVNNPYDDCINYLPKQHNVWVRCIASKRTNHEFIGRHKGLLYQYLPVKDQYYSGLDESHDYRIDDYRNPICAALGLAFRFKARKVLLFCCDEGYTSNRPGMVASGDGIWAYPQQVLAHKLIDANLYWLGKSGVKVGHIPETLAYANSKSVPEDGITAFFNS